MVPTFDQTRRKILLAAYIAAIPAGLYLAYYPIQTIIILALLGLIACAFFRPKALLISFGIFILAQNLLILCFNRDIIIEVLLLQVTILPPLIYTILSYKRKNFNFYHPLCLQFVLFILFYSCPVVILYFQKGIIYNDVNVISLAGIISFLVGCILFKIKNKQAITSDGFYFRQDSLIMKFLYVFGLALLFIYGYITKIPFLILKRIDIEGYRRTAEIGLGILKDPATYLIIIITIYLTLYYLLKRSKVKKSFALLIIALSIIIIFLCSGNRAVSLYFLIPLLAMINKHKKHLSIYKLAVIALLIIALLGAGKILRNPEKSAGNMLFLGGNYFYIAYYCNYVPIVRLINGPWGFLKFQLGKEYFHDLLYLIPRRFFPNKPLEYGYFYKDQLNMHFKGGGAAITAIGSLYVNFGLIGLIIAMFLIGFLYSFLYQKYLKESDALKAIIYSLLLFYLLEPNYFIAKAIIVTILAIMIIWTNKIMVTVARRNQLIMHPSRPSP